MEELTKEITGSGLVIFLVCLQIVTLIAVDPS